ncbi:MAG: dolichyl-phosphate beta-glucosyltransferase [Patescibacteria group bacterium]|nr:dolichyl-phosphate beta-glucosyltransferase [Patescibacteria group bacterium]
MQEIYLSIIIPAYNEEKRISNTLLAIDHYLSKQDYVYEIIVVNDGSKDKTAQIVGKFSRLVKNLRLIDNQENHGKGWVVKQGMLEAKGKYRLFMDADNATTIDHFEKMIPLFEEGCQIVIGSRDKKDAKGAKQAVPQSFLKRQLGNLGNILIQLVAVPGIWDTQCGFKAFTAKAAEDIFSRCKINRWGFDIEALALARKLNYRLRVIPVYWINNTDSRVSWKGYLNTFRELFKIKWNLIRKKYAQKEN